MKRRRWRRWLWLAAVIAAASQVHAQEQQRPERLTSLMRLQAALQAPLVVVPCSFRPYVGSIATRLPLTCCEMYGFVSAAVRDSFPPAKSSCMKDSAGAFRVWPLGSMMSYQK